MRAMVIKYAHNFAESKNKMAPSSSDKMPTSFLGGLIALVISTIAIVFMARFFIDFDTLDRKINEPDFKPGRMARRLPYAYYYCRHSPVPYIKWSLKNERTNRSIDNPIYCV